MDNKRKEFLNSIPLVDLLNIIKKNNIHYDESNVCKADIINDILKLTDNGIVNNVSKSALKFYFKNTSYKISNSDYVGEMRKDLIKYWNTNNKTKENNSSLNISKINTNLQQDIIIIDDDNDNDNNTNTIPIENNDNPCYLANSFIQHFYTLFHNSPSKIIEQNMFSPNAKVYLFLFTPDGKTMIAERKVEGNDIFQFLQMLSVFNFFPSKHEETLDDYGILKIKITGNITNPNQSQCLGLFSHFFEFFKSNNKYIIREVSFHIKTLLEYQPLHGKIPYKVNINDLYKIQ